MTGCWPQSAAQTRCAVFPRPACTKTCAPGLPRMVLSEPSSQARTHGTAWIPATRARLGFSIPSIFSGPRGITPAFGSSAPHSSARGTLTLLSNALLSRHHDRFRLTGGCAANGMAHLGVPRLLGRGFIVVHGSEGRIRSPWLRSTEARSAIVAGSVAQDQIGQPVRITLRIRIHQNGPR